MYAEETNLYTARMVTSADTGMLKRSVFGKIVKDLTVIKDTNKFANSRDNIADVNLQNIVDMTIRNQRIFLKIATNLHYLKLR